ncbi:MAG: MgtC/SapB family protein [Lachnospiraceae bacterium]|nr:MgtC/SapB family protein [Lachnospiraceae bacterium]
MTVEEFIIRLFVVAVIGLLIGVERQIGGHHIEIKTTFLIAVGTFAFCMIEILLGYPDIRMSANIVTGIGFLCSGVIFKNGLTVNGLNTSATLWSTSGISILVAYGYFKFAFIITVGLILLNMVLNITAKKIKPISFLVDNDSNAYQINVVCLKEEVNGIKEMIYGNLTDDQNIVNSIAVNSITPDKFRITVKVGTAHTDEYFVQLTNEIFKMNVLSVAYEKLDQ